MPPTFLPPPLLRPLSRLPHPHLHPHLHPRHLSMTASSPLFAAWCKDNPSTPTLRPPARAAHLEWAAQPSVVFAGPLTPSNPNGSLLIIQSPDLATAQELLDTDPYAGAAVFESVQLRQWKLGMASKLSEQAYMIWCVDRENAVQLRADTRDSHLQWWRDSGRSGIIGPFPIHGGGCGSMIVCNGESVEEVSQWSKSDPYALAGLFQSVDVHAVKPVIDHLS